MADKKPTEPLTDEKLEYFEDVWRRYKEDKSYNDIGRLNLVAVLGENAGAMLAEIRRLREILDTAGAA